MAWKATTDVYKRQLLQSTLDRVIQRNPDDKEFIQAVTEVFTSLEPVAKKHPEYSENGIFERIVEPERQIIFRVPCLLYTSRCV